MSARRSEAGFGLVTAIFVLVALAGAAATLTSLAGVERSESTLALQSARAFHAARSGIDWATFRTLRDGACPPATTLTLTEAGLRGFRVTVSCASSRHTDGAAAETVYQIASMAESGTFGGGEYVRRRLAGTVSNAP